MGRDAPLDAKRAAPLGAADPQSDVQRPGRKEPSDR